MNFYHGGHIGDVVYSLYAIMKFGGGDLFLGPHQTHNWGDAEIDALIPLCEAQTYIKSVTKVSERVTVDHDFTCIGGIKNPEDFFEWHGKRWPGNAHLKKRYFNSLWRARGRSLIDQMVCFNHDEPWLCPGAPPGMRFDVVFHAPNRKLVRSQDAWYEILIAIASKGFAIAVVGNREDIEEWPTRDYYTRVLPKDFLRAASLIANCYLFLGLASCNYVIAEGLDVFRFVDMAPQTEGAEPKNERGWDITNWGHSRVVNSALSILESHRSGNNARNH